MTGLASHEKPALGQNAPFTLLTTHRIITYVNRVREAVR